MNRFVFVMLAVAAVAIVLFSQTSRNHVATKPVTTEVTRGDPGRKAASLNPIETLRYE